MGHSNRHYRRAYLSGLGYNPLARPIQANRVEGGAEACRNRGRRLKRRD